MTKKDQQLIERIADGARKGQISRRDFMHYSLAAGLTVSGATGLWSTAARAAPKRGGTFRWGLHDGNTSDTHDPGTYLTRQMIFLAHTHRSFLTMIMGDGSLGPDLADSWSASDDASEWTFEITQNASFHNGKKLTADDVIAFSQAFAAAKVSSPMRFIQAAHRVDAAFFERQHLVPG